MRHHTLTLDTAPPHGLTSFATDATHGVDHVTAEERLAKAREGLAKLQARMMASETWSLLAIFQGMDAAGKDSTIAHVFSGLDPGGLSVTAFKAPSADETSHGFLWREHHATPRAGQFAAFNRSYYESVLVPRIHPTAPDLRHIPAPLAGPEIWRERLEDIVHFERMLSRQGVVICKFYLNLSRQAQAVRLLERLDDPHKAWKFKLEDLQERGHWEAYQAAYTEAIAATATPSAPWYIIPADHKPVARVLVAEILLDRLAALDIALPEPDPHMLRTVRQALHASEN